MLELLFLIAQGNQAPGGGQPQVMPGCGQGGMMVPLLLMFFVFYFLILRPQSKEKKRRKEMLDAVKKNDRVTTIGGIMGTVLSVKDNEITLKVDESNNTRITFTRGAIQTVTSSATQDAAGAKT